MKIAVLMTCYNRAETTLSCLRSFFAATCPADVRFDVWLNDDGSTDGTGEKCRAFFAGRKAVGWQGEAHIVKGSGHDYWCGGMRRVWQAAVDACADYNGYLWLNDDTLLHEGALRILLKAPLVEKAILVGAMSSRDGRTATYGGETDYGFASPTGLWQPLRQMNGNVVWIPQSVFASLGNLDDRWTHAMGDVDYSRTAVERGVPVLLTPVFVGICERNIRLPAWRNPTVPLLKRLKNLYSPLGYGEPPKLFRYCIRHDGLVVAVKNWLSCHWAVLFPQKG